MPILLQQWNHDQFSNHILAGGVAGHDSHLTPHIGPLYSLIPSCIPSLILASHSLTPLILFPAPPSPPPPHSPSPPKPSSHSHPLTTPIPLTPSSPPHAPGTSMLKRWWGDCRIDYILQSPVSGSDLAELPLAAQSLVMHSRYWEAKDMISFILHMVSRHAGGGMVSSCETVAVWSSLCTQDVGSD